MWERYAIRLEWRSSSEAPATLFGMARRGRNGIVVGVVAVLILAAAVYGPVALLAPLPATAGEVAVPEAATTGAPPTLPAVGSSGVTLTADAEPLSAGSADPIPMAAAAKLVTALVVLDARPLESGRAGPPITVTPADYATYAQYRDEGTRTVPVATGDSWSERDSLQAMLIASSNNHAEMLARWAFGSDDGFLDAADAWLAANGLASTVLADPTGLSAESVSTGRDLARVAALAMADPLLSEMLTTSSVTTLRGTTFENTIAYRSTEGIIGLSRSYTDEAGVCLVFAYDVAIGDGTTTVYGAVLGEPGYDELGADIDALLASLPDSLVERELLTAGTSYGVYETPWGATADAVAVETATGAGWAAAPAASIEVTLDPVITARRGSTVGSAVVPGIAGERTVALELATGIGDPGPLWRLANPGWVVPAFFGQFSSAGP
jgi:serine-type D-Ala-D-Ala carboxypeptidase (penicillin-binding protein 5/6)